MFACVFACICARLRLSVNECVCVYVSVCANYVCIRVREVCIRVREVCMYPYARSMYVFVCVKYIRIRERMYVCMGVLWPRSYPVGHGGGPCEMRYL